VPRSCNARGRSSDFQHGDIDAISNSAAVFGTAAAANSALSVLERPAVAPCLKKASTAKLKRFAASPRVRTTASIVNLSLPPVGDASTAHEFAINVEAHHVRLAVYFDLQLVQVGRVGLTFSPRGT
jgi:hypothetical protein